MNNLKNIEDFLNEEYTENIWKICGNCGFQGEEYRDFSRMFRKNRCPKCKSTDIRDDDTPKPKIAPAPQRTRIYSDFENDLDKYVIQNDLNKFAEIYNKGGKEWQETYIKKRPENQDIIDGINVGLFSLNKKF